MKRFVACQKAFVVSVFHFTLWDTRRGTSTACTTWDGCAARVPMGHVDIVERADLVPVPLLVTKDGRMDKLGRGTATPQTREFGKTKCRVRRIAEMTRPQARTLAESSWHSALFKACP